MPYKAFQILSILFSTLGSAAGQSVISTVVGTDWVFPASSVAASMAPLGRVISVTADGSDYLFGSDCDNHIIFRIDKELTLSIVAGNGTNGVTFDGPGIGTRLNCPEFLTVDGLGKLYFADSGRILTLSKEGRIGVVAGGGNNTGEGVLARQARVVPRGLAVDPFGNVYYSEAQRIRKVGTDGIVRTFAGTATAGFGGDGGPALAAQFSSPMGLASGQDGTVYVADYSNCRIRAISPSGIVRTVTGTGRAENDGDGGSALNASIRYPGSVSIDTSGTIRFVEPFPPVIRQITPRGVISTLVRGVFGYSGDGGQAANAALRWPRDITSDGTGNLYISDLGNQRIRRIGIDGRIETIAGNGGYRNSPEQGTPRSAWLVRPRSISIGSGGRLAFTDAFLEGTVRQLTGDGRLVRIAGSLQEEADLGFERPAVDRSVFGASQLNADQLGNFYVAARSECSILRISSLGGASRVAGKSTCGGIGLWTDNVPALESYIYGPAGLALNSAGELIFSEQEGHRIRRVDRDGVLRTLAGNGTVGFRGDGAASSTALLNSPSDIVVDTGGTIYFSDSGNHRVRKIARTGIITTVAGSGLRGFRGDGGLATESSLDTPSGLGLDSAGNLYIADSGNNRIRVISANGIIRTFAGSGVPGFGGDGGSPLNALLNGPMGVAVDSSGRVYIADTDNDRIRMVQTGSLVAEVSVTSLSLESDGHGTNPLGNVRVSSAVSGLSYSTSVSASASWLSINPAAGNLPVVLELSTNTAGLAPGQYASAITVNVPLATPATRQINVTLTVAPTQTPKLNIGSESISFRVQQGTQSLPMIGLSVSNRGGGNVNYTATLLTATGGNWLTVSPDKGQLSAGSNTTLNLMANPGNLAEGTYSATISISDGSATVNVPVTLSITRPQGKLLLSQAGLSFTAVEGGGTPTPQTFAVLNEGSGELPFEAKAILRSGDAPIKLENATGRLIRPLQDVGFVEVAPDTRNLTRGEYDADIRVTSPGLPAQTVIVKVTVLPRGSNPGPEVRPTGLVFIGTPGSIPRSEDVIVSNIAASPTTFNSNSLTFDGAKWISHLPSAATINPNEPRRIVVQPDFTGITAGVKRAALNLLFIEDGSSRTISILSVVPPAATALNKDGAREAAGCSSPTLRSEFLSLPEGGAISVGQPVPIEVKVVDDCGNLLLGNEKNTTAGVYAKFSNGDSDVRLVPIGNGVWSGTWRPLNPAAGSVTVSAISKFVQDQIVQDGRKDRTVRLTAGANAPIIRQLSLVNAASQKGDTPVAPGTLITIYGSNLATSTRNTSVPLPVEMDGTQVLLSGQPLPLLGISPNQVNLQIPFDISVNTSHQIVVRRGNALSVPESFNVASAQPGIFSRNATGTGQGVVIGPDQITIADAAKPAQRGQAIVIYCTGLGIVTEAVAPGAAAPNSPLAATVSPVEVMVGEKKAEVLFSGLTPGFSGLYQVNAVLATDTPTGDAISLNILTGGQISNVVTIAVR